MRTRTWLAGLAVGAAVLAVGPVASAQAVPASHQSGGATAGAVALEDWVDVGTYKTYGACMSDGANSIYSRYKCKVSTTTTNWHLWVDLDS
ncbi:hypothetical protein OKJ48_32115 [Streptomyces kunmingensis]|uniref:Uncharacterized protein n=1 Tax=Streptomyces kunmingensis TaxID=68225 RepID=A0ABU6CJD6_9ACTN|nr:hypothetical protein [Streptomyces kunmingensis]MEB3964841.1 hypothetical protein [Streptomyces kunmingensis]